jgi:alpha-1,3-rhamnosyltransferase
MSYPLVTVFTLAFNNGKYIVEGLESVRNQIYKNIQLIIIDDCSQDNTVELINNWIERNGYTCIFIKHEKNKGICESVVEVFQLAKGKYICGNSDDLWLPEKLEKQVEFMERFSEIGLVHSDANFIYDNHIEERHWATMGRVIPTGYVFEELLIENFIIGCSFLARTDLIRKYVDLKKYALKSYIDDYPRWLDLSRHTQFGYIDEPLVCYRVLPESASHFNNPQKHFNFWKSVSQIKLDYIKEYGASRNVKNQVINNIANESIGWAYHHYYNRRYYLAKKYLLFALDVTPSQILSNVKAFRLIAKLILGERLTDVVRGIKNFIFKK